MNDGSAPGLSEHPTRAAILLSVPFDQVIEEQIGSDRIPLPEYLALARALPATLIAPMGSGAQPRGGGGKARKFLRVAWAGFRRRGGFDVIISDLDRVGILLAALLKVTRSQQRHVVICHGKLPRKWDVRVIKAFRLSTHIDSVVCYGPEIASTVRHRLPELADRVAVVRHAADHRFWRPMGGPTEPLVVGAGLLHRDYMTLAEAVRDQDVSVEIAAHSPWVTQTTRPNNGHEPPANVRFGRYNYQELRRLYDRALMVAVPLNPSTSQSGSLVVYEAMAMGKPVLVTRTAGQESLALIQEGRTGFYVDPGDTARWSELIKHLLAHPDEARAMGARAREVVDRGLNLETYVAQMAKLVRAIEEHGRVSDPV